LIKPLSEPGYRVVTFDAQAHGRSSGSHVDFIEFAEAVQAVRNSIGLIEALIAHSFGAAASLHVLELPFRPQRTKGPARLHG
jgi:pimeloyl-ACP methyl ester carboxylesterase